MAPVNYAKIYDETSWEIKQAGGTDAQAHWVALTAVAEATNPPVPQVCSKDLLNDMADLIAAVLNDASFDADEPMKRLWPIRAANHRRGKELLRMKNCLPGESAEGSESISEAPGSTARWIDVTDRLPIVGKIKPCNTGWLVWDGKRQYYSTSHPDWWNKFDDGTKSEKEIVLRWLDAPPPDQAERP